MPKPVKVIIVRTAGTNCNEETGRAFAYFGGQVDHVHINALVRGQARLNDAHILAFPGGFSYGDDIASGRLLANELRLKLGDDIKRFMAAGKLMIGICNGFQILTKAGILPGLGTKDPQEATLFHNDSGKFEARWVHLKVEGRKSPWLSGLPSKIYLPVAHGEGKFIPKGRGILDRLKTNGQVVLTYCAAGGGVPSYPEDPNGSTEHIAGICDPTGRILGLMPHPERHFLFEQHPFWTRLKDRPIPLGRDGQGLGDGARIFENGISYAKKNLIS